MDFAYITVITNKRYLKGIKALVRSLKKVKYKYPLVVLIPNDADPDLEIILRSYGCVVKKTERPFICSELLQKNRIGTWNDTFLKLSVFDLVEFKKVIYIDSDMMVLKNIDHLFEKPHLSAVAAGQTKDPEWKRLNSGLIVIEPDRSVYNMLLDAIIPACTERLNKGVGYGDQDVINYCYQDWPVQNELHLSEEYNCLSSDIEAISNKYGFNHIAVIHYIGVKKPWENSARERRDEIKRLIRAHLWTSLWCFLRYYYYLR